MKKFGPFTPQEFQKASTWLTENNIDFNHLIDKKADKLFSENSPENLVNQAEFRTQTYLGAIFFIEANLSVEQENLFRTEMNIRAEQIPEKFKDTNLVEIDFRKTDSEKTKRQQRLWARILLAALILMWAFRFLSKSRDR